MILFCTLIEDTPKKQQKNIVIEEALFEQIGQGSIVAFETLYRLTEKTMYTYILSLIRKHEDALDILQETYLKIRMAAHLYRPMGKPLAWMFTIAKNLSYTKFRNQQHFCDLELMDLDNTLQYSYITDQEDRLVLQSAFKILDDTECEIIMLYAVSGMKHQEIANALEIPLSTALSKYHRALKKLRKHLIQQEASI